MSDLEFGVRVEGKGWITQFLPPPDENATPRADWISWTQFKTLEAAQRHVFAMLGNERYGWAKGRIVRVDWTVVEEQAPGRTKGVFRASGEWKPDMHAGIPQSEKG